METDVFFFFHAWFFDPAWKSFIKNKYVCFVGRSSPLAYSSDNKQDFEGQLGMWKKKRHQNKSEVWNNGEHEIEDTTWWDLTDYCMWNSVVKTL